jgi:hypothetical protein
LGSSTPGQQYIGGRSVALGPHVALAAWLHARARQSRPPMVHHRQQRLGPAAEAGAHRAECTPQTQHTPLASTLLTGGCTVGPARGPALLPLLPRTQASSPTGTRQQLCAHLLNRCSAYSSTTVVTATAARQLAPVGCSSQAMLAYPSASPAQGRNDGALGQQEAPAWATTEFMATAVSVESGTEFRLCCVCIIIATVLPL